MAQFRSIVDFEGFYTGSYDGRQAEVEIVVSHPTAGQPIGISMKFVERERNLEYSTNFQVSPQDSTTHVLRNITLHAVTGTGDIHWSRLPLHTWDTNFLSGVSIWNNQEFGMSFSRVGH